MVTIIETTADGSPTLYRADMDEHYHSVKGALAESLHVYLEKGWRSVSESAPQPIRVFEIGFGTGMNTAVTAVAARQSAIPTEYVAVELYPLPKDAADKIAAAFESEYRDALESVNDAPWEELYQINPYFFLHKTEDNLISMILPEDIDVVYFDAFAPEKQPEMWSEEIFRKIFAAMRPGGVLTTYCAKGAIRRMLQEIGFLTERLPGPSGGKREILRATRPASSLT